MIALQRVVFINLFFVQYTRFLYIALKSIQHILAGFDEFHHLFVLRLGFFGITSMPEGSVTRVLSPC